MSEWAFDDNLFEVKSPLDIDIEAFKDAMESRTFVCIRGLVSPQSMYDTYDRIVENFDRSLDAPGANQTADAVRRNFQTIKMGGESRSASNDDARFFRALYSPFWEEDVWGLHDSLRMLARVRNLLAGLDDNFALEGTEDNGLWTAARFHQYPQGGGFFRRHTDHVAKDIVDSRSTEFYQVVLTMTAKGEHYQHGGAFVDIGETRYCLDDNARMGDILVYDGRTMHGVEDIDPGALVDLDRINGRLSGFATLYKKM